jgi:hypothetical protein
MIDQAFKESVPTIAEGSQAYVDGGAEQGAGPVVGQGMACHTGSYSRLHRY